MGISALQYIAADPSLTSRFLAISGLDVADLRRRARDPGFLPGLLDFILAHEPTLVDFSAQSGHSPQRVVEARTVLGGTYKAGNAS
ncbi:Protein of unknown function [Consotaella salsifontis]|uniref:DUF3572 family protein n=1 Tax=Consotaella salsifontis TaxID=1365950 RepID=A0A1T4LP13_9HYPH|nr:Protein of unknown function [Consotaella salsifontis]